MRCGLDQGRTFITRPSLPPLPRPRFRSFGGSSCGLRRWHERPVRMEMVRLAGKWCAVARRLHGPSSLRCRDGSDANPRDCSPIICFFAPKAGGTRLGTAMAQQENGAKEAEQRRKPSDCVNNRSGHLASQRRVRSRDPLARDHEDEFVPDGQITKNSSTPIAKNIPLSPSGKSVLSARAIPFREEGRWPSSRTLGRDAVDAAASGALAFAGRFP